jgi:hypothetical protein
MRARVSVTGFPGASRVSFVFFFSKKVVKIRSEGLNAVSWRHKSRAMQRDHGIIFYHYHHHDKEIREDKE